MLNLNSLLPLAPAAPADISQAWTPSDATSCFESVLTATALNRAGASDQTGATSLDSPDNSSIADDRESSSEADRPIPAATDETPLSPDVPLEAIIALLASVVPPPLPRPEAVPESVDGAEAGPEEAAAGSGVGGAIIVPPEPASPQITSRSLEPAAVPLFLPGENGDARPVWIGGAESTSPQAFPRDREAVPGAPELLSSQASASASALNRAQSSEVGSQKTGVLDISTAIPTAVATDHFALSTAPIAGTKEQLEIAEKPGGPSLASEQNLVNRQRPLSTDALSFQTPGAAVDRALPGLGNVQVERPLRGVDWRDLSQMPPEARPQTLAPLPITDAVANPSVAAERGAARPAPRRTESIPSQSTPSARDWHGIDGAKNAVGQMQAEQNISLRPGPEQTLPSAAANYPNGLVEQPKGEVLTVLSQASGENSAMLPLPGESEPMLTTWSSSSVTEAREDPLSALERMHRRVYDGVMEFKRVQAEAMTVVLRPNSGTEVELQLSLRDGQVDIEAMVRRGDVQLLHNHWSQLQSTLAAQGVRLGALNESTSLPNPGLGQSWTGQQQEAPVEKFLMEGEAARSTGASAAAGEDRSRQIMRVEGRVWERWA